MSASRAITLGDGARPAIIAIVNASPDSFYAESAVAHIGDAIALAERHVREGAVALDIGGESTRPGSARVDAATQMARVVPLIAAIRAHADATLANIPISIDTTRASVASSAMDAGADAINDVSAGTEDPELLPLAGRRGAGVILMHRAVDPTRDRFSDAYASGSNAPGAAPMGDDIAAAVVEVARVLAGRIDAALAVGVLPESILIDPGLGFGKTVAQNMALIRATRVLALCTPGAPDPGRGWPVLSALSRKSFTGRVSLGRDSTPAERLEGTLALSVVHASGPFPAAAFRVHDVEPHVRALRALRAAAATNPY
jgi:dihydropteroate synthase